VRQVKSGTDIDPLLNLAEMIAMVLVLSALVDYVRVIPKTLPFNTKIVAISIKIKSDLPFVKSNLVGSGVAYGSVQAAQ
jgi:hypothetical protein